MPGTWKALDGLLRGEYTRREQLAEGRLELDARLLLTICIVLGAAYGAFMGLYAALRGGPGGALQILTTTVKVPLLFLLTLVVTFPSLYVFSALARCRLSYTHMLRLLLAAMAVNLALLASFGPVTGFFTLSTTSYPFMIVINVVFFTISGLAGLSVLRRALATVFGGDADAPAALTPAATPVAGGVAPEQVQARRIFSIWTLIYAIVGAQMGWILRPFIGAPNVPFQVLRSRESNFFVVFLEQLHRLLFG